MTTRERCAMSMSVLTAILVIAPGIMASSTNIDVDIVRQLSHVQALARVDGQVDPLTPKEVDALLRRPLDTDTVVQITLLNNRDLRAQLRDLGVDRGRLQQAGLFANPTFEVEALPERNTEIELRLEYEITSLLFASMRSKAAAADLEAARFRAAGGVVQLAYEARSAFYALQAAHQRLDLAQRTLDAFAAGRDAAVALLSAGNIPELDASTQIAAYERARITVAQLTLEVADRREALQRLMGLHGQSTSWRLAGTLPAVPDEGIKTGDFETRALTASLELAATKSRLEAVARRTGVSRAEGWIPDIAVDVHSLSGDPSEGSGGRDDPHWRFGGGISLSLPFFDRQQGTTAAYEAEFDALLERYHALAVDVRSAARDVRNRLVSAHARALQFQKIIVPAQSRVMQETLLQYNAMQIGIFQLLQARREQLDVELMYVDTLREYWSAAAGFEAMAAGQRVTSATPTLINTTGAAAASTGGH